MCCGRVRLLHRQTRVVTRPVKACRFSRVNGISAVKVFLVDAVSKSVRNSAKNGSSDFAGSHFTQLNDRRLRVERGVWRYDQVGCVFQRRCRRHQVIRLTLVNVEGCCPDAVVLQGSCQSCLVHKAASGCVNQKCTWKWFETITVDGVNLRRWLRAIFEPSSKRDYFLNKKIFRSNSDILTRQYKFGELEVSAECHIRVCKL